jgi:hypothetical protein
MRRVLIGLALLTAPLAAHTTIPASFAQVVTEATFILRGRVTDVRSARSPERGVETIATVAVDHVLKGGSTNFVAVRVPGGVIGGTRTIMAGAPSLNVNDHAIFFLAQGADNGWRPVGLSMGIHRVHVDRTTGLPVVNPPLVAGHTASIGPVVRGDVRRKPLAVGEFESLVRLVMLTPTRGSAKSGGRQ